VQAGDLGARCAGLHMDPQRELPVLRPEPGAGIQNSPATIDRP
jgi:hypothetical protein